jgi:hypothetical protein
VKAAEPPPVGAEYRLPPAAERIRLMEDFAIYLLVYGSLPGGATPYGIPVR